MNKVLALIVAAAVFMMVAVLMMTMTSSSLLDFDSSVKDASNSQVCQAQVERAQNTGDWSRVSDRCLSSNYIPEENKEDALAASYQSQLTS